MTGTEDLQGGSINFVAFAVDETSAMQSGYQL